MSDKDNEHSRGERDDARYKKARSSSGTYHETDNLHKLLIDSVHDYAIFALDRTGHILTWNPGAQRFKGYKAHEIIGKHFSVFYPPEAVASGHPEYELVIAESEGRYEEEGWRIRKDGTRFWANVVISALRDETGELIGFAKVTRDLTERRRAAEALRQSEQRFRLIVQNVQDYGIFMLDPTGRIVSWNEGAQRIKGYTAEEIIGQHFSVFYPEEDNARGKPAWELEVAADVGRFEDEGWRVRKDGTLFWANVIITALRDEAGVLVGYGKVTRDLTDRRAAEVRAIADARRVAEAEAANRAKAEFLTAMSHELRTPLNAIGGYTDLLLLGVHGSLNDDQVGSLERIRASQNHLLGLITDLLNFSKIEAGKLTYDIKTISIAEVAANVRPMIEPQAASKNIEIEWQPADPEVKATADQARVEQILLNLLTNAVKFTLSGGRITVNHFVGDGHISLEVKDTGVGIPADKIEQIFEPFVQVGRTLTTNAEGAGLGLAISRDLARAMHGDLAARSDMHHGSTFTLTLPRAT
ncbi:MAG TPA: PAS domain-containing sensor histidine kinase [Longimicrobiales bacterium]|nr:PAS domain-containing sensor histidine kinase [Longimicrobiales bacterium]